MTISNCSRYEIWSPIPDRLIKSAALFVDKLPLKRSTHTNIFQFVKSLVYRSRVSSSVLASSLVYLERLTNSGKLSAPKATSKELAFVVALLLASKFLDDRGLSVARVVNITRDQWTPLEASLAERDFLDHLDYNLNLKNEELVKFLTYE